MFPKAVAFAEKCFSAVFGKELAEWLKWRLRWLIREKYLIGVFPVVIDQGKVLLIKKRLGVSGMGQWQVPGGGKGRLMPEDAAIRELREETGIIAKGLVLIHAGCSEKHRDFHLVYLVTSFEGRIAVGDTREIADAKFVPFLDLQRYLTGEHLEYAERAFVRRTMNYLAERCVANDMELQTLQPTS